MAPPLPPLRRLAGPYLVLAGGLLVAVAGGLYAHHALRLQQQARFDERVDDARDALDARIQTYVALLRAARGLFGAGHEPTRAEFRAFVESVGLPWRDPGIRGLGFARALAPGEVAAHERVVRAEGFPNYRAWRSGPGPVSSAILFLEPFDWRNQRAFGFDMFSEPVRRAAMERARDTGVPASTAPVELVQEAGLERQMGFLVYLAVLAGDHPDDAAERRATLRGWVYAPFRAGDLLGATFAGVLGPLGVEVRDAEVAGPAGLLFESWPEGAPRRALGPPFDRVVNVPMCGRTWSLRFQAAPGLVGPWERVLPALVALAGLVATVLLFRFVASEVLAAEQARLAAGRSRFLADAGETLASSFDVHATLALVVARAARDQAEWCVAVLRERDRELTLVGQPAGTAGGTVAEDAAACSALAPTARVLAAVARGRPTPHLAPALSREALRALAPEAEVEAEALPRRRRATLLAVPLVVRGERLGGIAMLAAGRRRFRPSDVAWAEDLARLAGAAIDAARLYLRAQEAVRQRDDFLSVATHELRTPLSSLALQSESLRLAARRGQGEQVLQRAEVIRRNVDRLSRLITHLLDVGRLEAGKLQLELDTVDLADVAREVAERLEEDAERAGCRIELELAEGVVGRWDRLRLDQVATNLLANAVKYAPGQPIVVTVAGQGGLAVLAVRDRGPGIAAEAQGRIFERFERAGPGGHAAGFGLGLWIVRRLVEAMGGTIRVESAPGQGAAFVVALPPGPVEAEAPPPRAGEATAPAG